MEKNTETVIVLQAVEIEYEKDAGREYILQRLIADASGVDIQGGCRSLGHYGLKSLGSPQVISSDAADWESLYARSGRPV